MNTEELKKEILSNLSKNKQYVKPIFRIENNLTPKQCFDILYPEKIKKCRYCGKESEFKSFSLGYKDICDSKECKHKHRIETVTKTNLEKYGVENVSQLESIKKKKIETVFAHYGVYDYLNSEQNKHNMYDENAFHLDHKFSIKKGFEEKIPPEIIGSLKNLEMIPGKKNCSKRANCSITKEELLDESDKVQNNK